MSEMLTSAQPAGQSQALRDVLAHCEYLVAKGYAPASMINNWKVALRNVFEVVDGEDYEGVDLGSLDIEEYLGRFQTLALSGQKYKSESITAYKNRVRRAIEAYRFFLENGKPPSFSTPVKRPKGSTDDKASAPVVALGTKREASPAGSSDDNGLIDYPFQLKDGRMATLRLPGRLASDDVNRLSNFLRTLQDDPVEQRQLPERTQAA